MKRKPTFEASAVLLVAMIPGIVASAAEFTVQRHDDAVTVNVDGKLFTQYLVKSGNKPALWPIVGPTGKEMTRAYPMVSARDNERADHVHHRSLWFTHGDVNGTSFWAEERRSGIIEHREFLRVEGGKTAMIVTRNDWLDNDGEKLCSDVRSLTFGADNDRRWIDFDITIIAGENAVEFGDTKEGTFGVRVAGTMKVDADMGGKIVNSLGDTDKDAWGKRASWVDYHGPVEGEILGIAVLNHPTSFRFPTYWHVRTYGLFAANPFGVHNFENNNEKDGSYTLEPGRSFAFRYRVVLHKGDEQEGRIPEAFVEYAKVEKPTDEAKTGAEASAKQES
jgi:hypothetical protein